MKQIKIETFLKLRNYIKLQKRKLEDYYLICNIPVLILNINIQLFPKVILIQVVSNSNKQFYNHVINLEFITVKLVLFDSKIKEKL